VAVLDVCMLFRTREGSPPGAAVLLVLENAVDFPLTPLDITGSDNPYQ
jgi:hypothetical protein